MEDDHVKARAHISGFICCVVETDPATSRRKAPPRAALDAVRLHVRSILQRQQGAHRSCLTRTRRPVASTAQCSATTLSRQHCAAQHCPDHSKGSVTFSSMLIVLRSLACRVPGVSHLMLLSPLNTSKQHTATLASAVVNRAGTSKQSLALTLDSTRRACRSGLLR